MSTFFIDNKIDTGKLLQQQSTVLDERETAGSLHDKLAVLGGDLLCALDELENGIEQTISK